MAIPGIQPQTRLGRYELLARLATGGMGEIFLARLQGAAGFEKLCVVKRILPHLADDVRFRQMLIAEARIAAKMSHANICQVNELGETDGQLYIVMEYLDGVTILPLLRKSSKEGVHLDYGFIAAVVQQTCDALHYAHELKERGEPLGLVHRDVTPSNIFLTESGVAKVLDFGIAKAKGASTQTQEGTVKGKYAYMAPEQLRGASIDRRVDVFALGVVLYEMLALRRLFQRKTDYLTFRAVMEQPIPDIRRYRDDVPAALAAALDRALDREPANRFDTARQLASAVLDAIASVKRPWTQGEIGDFVRANFADELGRRSQQVASAIHRTASGVHSTRSTMPLIAQSEETEREDTDEDIEFPSVETDIDRAPPIRREATSEFQSVTPPPFAGDSKTSAPGLAPIRPTPDPTQGTASVVVVHHRSVLWPLLAVSGVAIAGGALFLVWKQMQEKPAPTEIRITQEPTDVGQPQLAVGSAQPAMQGSATQPIAPLQPVPTHPSHEPQQQPRTGGPMAPYYAVVNRHMAKLNACLNDHYDDALPASAKVTIAIAASGASRTVTIAPTSLDAAAVGSCIRTEMLSVHGWPKREVEFEFALNIPHRS